MPRGTFWTVSIFILAAVLLTLLITSPNIGNDPTRTASPRAALSEYIVERALPSEDSAPLAITLDDSGMVWYASTNKSRIGKFDPKDGSFVEYQIPPNERTTSIWSMVFDDKGNLWFPSTADNSIWKFNPNTKEFKRYQISTNNSFPIQVDVDKLGRIWFTELNGNKLGVIDPSTDSITEHTPPTTNSGPAGLFITKDGAVWFAQTFSNRIAKYEPQTGEFTEYTPAERIYSPLGIAIDENGSIWFTEHAGSLFSKLVPSNGAITRYPTSAGAPYPVTLPYWVYKDTAGNVWFNEHTGNRIARFDPEKLVLIEYEVLCTTCVSRLANVLQMALGRNNEAWFTQWSENKIAAINVTKPIPFEVHVEPAEIAIKPGEITMVSVIIKGNSTGRIQLNASSTTSYTSRPRNITVVFEPSSVEVSMEGSRSILMLTAHNNLQPGDYFLAVTATDYQVFYSKLIRIHVGEEE